MQTTGIKVDEAKVDVSKPVQSSSVTATQEIKNDIPDPMSPLAALQSDVQPVGHDYVEEVIKLI